MVALQEKLYSTFGQPRHTRPCPFLIYQQCPMSDVFNEKLRFINKILHQFISIICEVNNERHSDNVLCTYAQEILNLSRVFLIMQQGPNLPACDLWTLDKTLPHKQSIVWEISGGYILNIKTDCFFLNIIKTKILIWFWMRKHIIKMNLYIFA